MIVAGVRRYAIELNLKVNFLNAVAFFQSYQQQDILTDKRFCQKILRSKCFLVILLFLSEQKIWNPICWIESNY